MSRNPIVRPALALFIVVIAMMFTSFAHAIPSAKDIDQAVKSENFSKAESLIREVIAAKPESARAHYNLAQILEFQHKSKDALVAINKAQELDKSLSFAGSVDKFHATLNKIEINAGVREPPKPTQSRPVVVQTPPPQPSGPPTNPLVVIMWIVGVVGSVVTIGYIIYRINARREREAKAAYQEEREKEKAEVNRKTTKVYLDLNDSIKDLDTEIKLTDHTEVYKTDLIRRLQSVKTQLLANIAELKAGGTLGHPYQITKEIDEIKYAKNRTPASVIAEREERNAERIRQEQRDRAHQRKGMDRYGGSVGARATPRQTTSSSSSSSSSSRSASGGSSTPKASPVVEEVHHHHYHDSGRSSGSNLDSAMLGGIAGMMLSSAMSGSTNNSSSSSTSRSSSSSSDSSSSRSSSYDSGSSSSSSWDSGSSSSSSFDSGSSSSSGGDW